MMMTKRRDIVDSCSFSHGLRMMELYLLCIYLNAKRLQLRCKHSSSNLKANDDLTGEFFENLKRIDLAWPNQAHTQSHSHKIENTYLGMCANVRVHALGIQTLLTFM